MSIAPRLTKTDDGWYDLLFEDGIFAMAEDGTEAAQHGMTRILIFAAYKDAPAEESLNGEIDGRENTGTQWYGGLFSTLQPRAWKEFHIKKRILETPNNDRLEEFTWTQTGHSLAITGRVVTPWGDEDLTGTVTPL